MVAVQVSTASSSSETYWSAVWRTQSTRKSKTCEDEEAVLVVKKRSATLKGMEGETLSVAYASVEADLETLREGEVLMFDGKEIQVGSRITAADYSTGKCFLRSCSGPGRPTLHIVLDRCSCPTSSTSSL